MLGKKNVHIPGRKKLQFEIVDLLNLKSVPAGGNITLSEHTGGHHLWVLVKSDWR